MDLLGAGRASRLHRALVREQQVAQEVSSFAFPEIGGATVFVVEISARADTEAEALETAMWREFDRLGRYRIESLIGRGGMGAGYLATDTQLDRRVALKVLSPELTDDARFRERFMAELRSGTTRPMSRPTSPRETDADPLQPIMDALAQGAARLEIPDGVALLLAVSGGPDSTALLHAAARLAPARGWRLSVAHLDHALRAESADEAAAVAASAKRLGLPVEIRRTDVRSLAAAEHRSLEDAGRQARYRFLEAAAARMGPESVIATAHTADDAAETILLRLARGSGLRGVRGIPARRGRIVRPLLGARRETLRAALDAAGIRYVSDPSNADAAHTRNRVRAGLLPALERVNPGAVEALLRFGRLAADDDDLLDALAAAELAARRDAEEGGAIGWRNPPARALGRRMLRLAIGEPAPSAERIEAVLDAAEGPSGGLTIELGQGRRATVRERRIRLG